MSVENLEKCPENHETSTGRKTDCFWEIMKIKKTCIATTRILAAGWPSHLPYGAHSWKKRALAKNNDFTCNCWACTRFLRMHKILVHAQESCACTRILCMRKNLVHAQESCACTRFLCMHTNYKQNRWFLPKHVFSRMGSIWKMGRPSGRQNSSRGDARRFYFYDFPEKNGFPAHGRFMTFRTFFEIFDEKRLFPKMTQTCLGVLGGHPRPIRTRIWLMLAKTHSTQKNRKLLKNIYYKNPYQIS